MVNTPLGSVQISRTVDPLSLSKAYQYQIQVFHADPERSHTITGARFVVRDNNAFDQHSGIRWSRSDFDLLLTLAEIRVARGDLPTHGSQK
jgi:hypothetical protein